MVYHQNDQLLHLSYRPETKNNLVEDSAEKSSEAFIYDLASLSKVLVTQFLTMKLIQENKLTLSMHDENILSHISGTLPWFPFYQLTDVSQWSATVQHLIAHQQTKRHYSDVGYLYFGKKLEILAGKSLDSLWEEEFLQKYSSNVPEVFKQIHYHFKLKKMPRIFSSSFIPTSVGNPFEKKLCAKFYSSFQHDKIKLNPLENILWRSERLRGECNDFNAHFINEACGHAGLFGSAVACAYLASKFWDKNFFDPLLVEKFCRASKSGHFKGMSGDPSVLQLDDIGGEHLIGHHGFTGCTLLYDFKRKLMFLFLSNRQYYGLDDEGHYPPWKNYVTQLIKTFIK